MTHPCLKIIKDQSKLSRLLFLLQKAHYNNNKIAAFCNKMSVISLRVNETLQRMLHVITIS